MVILPDTDSAGAMVLAENLRSTIASASFVIEDGKAIPVTASIGVSATVPQTEASAEKLIALADLALYRAKLAGRNRVEAATNQ